MGQMSDITVSFLTAHPFWACGLLGVAVFLSALQYRRTNPPLDRRWRFSLLALRIIALGTLFLSLMEPVLTFTSDHQRQPRLTLFRDISASMNTTNGGVSRSDQVDHFLDEAANKDILSKYVVQTIFVCDSSYDTPTADSASRRQTALGAALRRRIIEEGGTPAERWMLISDGLNNSGVDLNTAVRRASVPIVAIGVGRPVPGADVALHNLNFNPVNFEGQPAEISAEVRWRDIPDSQRVTIELVETDKILSSKQLTISGSDRAREVTLSFKPQGVGPHFFEVRVRSGIEERQKKNNFQSFGARTLKNRQKALLVSDGLDWDYKFLKRALVGFDRIDVTESIVGPGGKVFGLKFPDGPAELSQFDVVILHNPSPRSQDSRYRDLDAFVRAGGGLMALLGERYLTLGGRRELDALLPIAPAPEFTQPIRGLARLFPRSDNALHPVLHIGADGATSEQAWREAPPFEYAYAVVATDTALVSLVETPFTGLDAPSLPVIGVSHRSAGKVLFVNGAPLWKMAFADNSSGSSDAANPFATFAQNAVLWLAQKDDRNPMRVESIKDIFERGENPEFRATVLDNGFREIADAQVEIFISRGGGADTTATTLSATGKGVFRGFATGLDPGEYRYRARVSRAGDFVRNFDGRFMIASEGAEERDVTPDFEVLKNIAGATGGAFFPIDSAAGLSSALSNTPIVVSERREARPANTSVLLAILIVALGLEWAIRKRRQLL